MRIGFVLPGFSASADDWCIPALRNLVQQLAMTDEVWVLTLRYPGRAGRYRVFGADVAALGGGTRRRVGSLDLWRRALTTLAREHGRRRFDVLHAFWATEAGALASVAGRILRVPTIVSLAGGELVGLADLGYGDQLAPIERVKVGLALRLANVVAAGSRAMLDLAAQWLGNRGGRRLCHLPLGVDANLFRPAVGEKAPRTVRLLHVASLVPVKDQATLLRAVARLDQESARWALDLVGTGPLETNLRALAVQLGIAGSVCLRGAVDHGHLPGVYRAADVFVLCSRHEAQGMAVLEAAACGLPIVGTRVGVIPELAPGEAVVVPTADPVAMAVALNRLLRDPDRQRALGQAARARAVEEFDLERCTARFRRAYAEAGRYVS